MSAQSYRGIEYGTYELEQRPRKSVELAVEAGGAQPLSPVTPCCSIWEWDSVYSILLVKTSQSLHSQWVNELANVSAS